MFRDGCGYDDLVEEVISEFQAEYGNVDVEYVLLPWTKWEKRSLRLLKTGPL